MRQRSSHVQRTYSSGQGNGRRPRNHGCIRQSGRCRSKHPERRSCRAAFQYRLWLLFQLPSWSHRSLSDHESRRTSSRLWICRDGSISRRTSRIRPGPARRLQLPKIAGKTGGSMGRRFSTLVRCLPDGFPCHGTGLCQCGEECRGVRSGPRRAAL